VADSFDGELNNEFWREYIENRKMLAQLRDSELAKEFWDERL
jgi:hypothetical protein